ncbi:MULTISPECIES: hypothetical protein [Corynebacterium]|uniref:hypothetical protein n=1 Tax=Corynebacterium TaxID=1716 RepID=UPI0008A468E6|nr:MULTISPECIES: hypothetical protein [Corynebacterium]MDK6492690.1 hypothetical protein [Corynebacterium coyleae]MDK8663459.1 hypothetical protein [Corynebacterium coyleae]MDK8706923.1 hypothetical protein [Corynebacterium coyleae]MDK8733770.1 hypothetical protein [Corynebacterium coyleae]MDK8893023.1 hypothetical protein [Corynebacterium coyleae]
MNLRTIGMAYALANQGLKYFRDQNDKRERDIYQSLIDTLKDGDLSDLTDKFDRDQLQELYGAARAEAGEITRQAHERLDRRRAAFDADAPLRAAQLAFLKDHAKEKKDEGRSVLGTIGSVIKWSTLSAVAAGSAWAAWEFFLKEKIAELRDDSPADLDLVSVAEGGAGRAGGAGAGGTSTLVYSTTTEDDREARSADDSDDSAGRHRLED